MLLEDHDVLAVLERGSAEFEDDVWPGAPNRVAVGVLDFFVSREDEDASRARAHEIGDLLRDRPTRVRLLLGYEVRDVKLLEDRLQLSKGFLVAAVSDEELAIGHVG